MSLGGMIGGLIGSSQELPTVDVRPLLDTINKNSKYQQDIINQMPQQVRQMLMDYAKSNDQTASTYQNAIAALGAKYMEDSSKVYGPDTDAAKSAMNSARTQIYSTVPGTQNAIRNALAASGGLSRGAAGTQLAQPYVQAAQQYGQKASDIATDQLAKGQNAKMQALQTVQSMDDTMFQNLFGMSKQQASTILNTSNEALQNQLSMLINTANYATDRTLSANGIAVNNAYQNAVTRNAQQAAIWNGLADTVINGAASMAGAPGGGGAPPVGMV